MINNRLKKISELVTTNSLLDIGCDHAFLDIYIAQKKSLKKIVASDNKKGPLEIARKNIEKYQLQDKIKLKLGDGLDVYEDDIDTIIISGMGGRSIIGILKKHEEYFKDIDTFILSPNNYIEDVRRYLVSKNYKIVEEELVKEKKQIYQIIKFSRGKCKYKKRDYFFGPILLNNKNNLFKEYYNKELMSRKIILKLLPKHISVRKIKIKREIKLIERELD